MSDHVSKTTVVMTLIVAIVISLGGTISVLTKLSSYNRVNQISGFAQSMDGYVQIEIERVLSIVVRNNTIDFGNCDPVPDGQIATISSNMSGTQINATITNCSGDQLHVNGTQYIRISNDGNLPGNISVYTDGYLIGETSFELR